MEDHYRKDDDREDDYRDSDDRPAPYVWLKALGSIAVVMGLFAIIWWLAETPKNRNLAGYPNTRERAAQPTRTSPHGADSSGNRAAGAVATSGEVAPPTDEQAYELSSPAIIQDLDTITGELDGTTLVGRKVDLRVPVLEEHTPVTFWIGPSDNRLLVVMDSDVRGSTEGQTSAPTHGTSPLHRGQEAIIRGTIQQVPPADERARWGLTGAQRREVESRRIYLRADSVRSSGHGE